MIKLPSSFQLHRKFILSLLLIGVFIWSLFSIKWTPDLFHPGGLTTLGQIFYGLIHPDFSADILLMGLQSSWITLAYAVAGMSLAIIYAFIVGILASGTLTSSKTARFCSKIFFRGILGFTRSIHEL